MPWAVAAAGVAAAGSIAASEISSSAASSAASKQAGAITAGQSQSNERVAPYADAGVPAVHALADFAGLNGSDAAKTAMEGYAASPGYAFSLDQGLRAVDAGAAAKGILRSGATLKAEQSFGAGLASQDFGNYVSRLQSLATLGSNAAAGQASTDTSAAGSLASIYGTQGTNQSAALGQIGGAVSGFANNPKVQNAVGSYFGGTTNPGPAAPSSYYDASLPLSSYAGGAAPQGY